MSLARLVIAGLIAALAVLPAAYADEHKTYSAELEGFDYPMRFIGSSSRHRAPTSPWPIWT
jgi:hypothetical protein